MNKIILNSIKVLLIIFELLLLGMYLFPNVFDFGININDSLNLFLIIVLIFFTSFFYIKSWTKHEIIIRLAFLFTLVADYLMTYLEKHFELSICFFFLAQLSYFSLINLMTKCKYLKSSLFLYLLCVFILLIIGKFIYPLGLLEILAIIYISLSLTNIIYLIRIKKKNLFLYCFLIGLILFFICDISIGLSKFNIQNETIRDLVNFMIWGSYGPSQIILVNTLIEIKSIGGVYYEKNLKS